MSMDYIWLEDKLEGEYKEVFDKAKIFADMQNVNGDTGDDMLMDLLDLLLTAQNEGKPIERIIGSDMEKFCRSYFSSYTMKNRLLDFPKRFYQMMWMVFVLEVFFAFTEDDFQLFHSTTDISGYLLGFLGGWAVFLLCKTLLQPFMFRWKWLTAGRFGAIVIVLSIGALFGGLSLVGDYTLEIPSFSVFFVSGLYILIYIVVRSILRYRNHGSIRKQRMPFEESGIKNYTKQVEEEIPAELVKRYHKKNKRLIRRGKEPMTPEHYMEVLHKENEKNKKGDIIGIGIVALVVLALIIQVAFTSTLFDTIIFILVILVAEIPAMALFRFGKKGNRLREKILEECEERGITILEYVEGEDK